jgi:hypothetical protein
MSPACWLKAVPKVAGPSRDISASMLRQVAELAAVPEIQVRRGKSELLAPVGNAAVPRCRGVGINVRRHGGPGLNDQERE